MSLKDLFSHSTKNCLAVCLGLGAIVWPGSQIVQAQNTIENLLFDSRTVQLFESLPEPSNTTLQRELRRIQKDISVRDVQLKLQSGVTTGMIPSWYRSITDTSQAVLFKSNYRYTDLNADGQTDMLYTGYPLSYNKPYTLIWLYKNQSYHLLGQQAGLLYALLPNSPPAFVVEQGQCCGHYVSRFDVVEFMLNKTFKGGSSFNIRRSYVAFHNTYLPRGTRPIQSEQPVRLTSQRVELRFSPVERNSMDTLFTMREGKKVFGNIIAVYHNNDRGLLLATYQQEMGGSKWWLVALEPRSLGSYNRFYNDQIAYRVGWIPASAAQTETTSATDF